MSNLDHFKAAFNSVGWFIPPYVTLGYLSLLAKEIHVKGPSFSQDDLAAALSLIYSADNLAAMVTERYPITPFINEYKEIISESIQAHFLGLDHVAVAGLMPVIEGAGRKLTASREIKAEYIKDVFVELAGDCKNESINKNIGATDEVISMMDSFAEFIKNHFYLNSKRYALSDKTNRHGILHGDYTDKDYGAPINFYKSIAAVDFLCFVSAFRANISWMAPSPTAHSLEIGSFYKACIALSKVRPK
ncbi:hypothetical protein [uncultured Pseudomonas sp.]|uniref:hypothetical protein n=1 Tax=uncultured Pseudomonas sp. TaxID=114707 RepID=UPI0026339F79|nr:hypothetical protein [uncultured Pseudomonas sp.]